MYRFQNCPDRIRYVLKHVLMLSVGYYWLYLEFTSPGTELCSCWVGANHHWAFGSCHSYSTTVCCHLPVRISASLPFGLSVCRDMAERHWRFEFLLGCWQSNFSCYDTSSGLSGIPLQLGSCAWFNVIIQHPKSSVHTNYFSFHHRVAYMILATSNILLGGFCSPESNISKFNKVWWVFPDPLKYVVLYTTSGIRYRLRCYSKWRQRTKLETVSELRTLPSNHRNEKPIVLASESKPERQHEQYGSFLSYDLLMLIVRELHYVDVINLSLASRSLRDALLPRADIAARTQALKIYTCEVRKSECSICGNQICPVSSHQRVMRSLLIHWYSHAQRSTSVTKHRHFVTSRNAEPNALNATIVEFVLLENPTTHSLAV